MTWAVPDRPNERRAGATAPAAAPAMPAITPGTMYRGAPYLLVRSGQRYSIGWHDARKAGPCFVLARIGVMDGVKVLDRFPLTEDGWARAWAGLVKLDVGAAKALQEMFTATAADERARAGLPQLEAATVSYLPQLTFLGGYARDGDLDPGKPYDLRFLDNRLAVFRFRQVDVLAETPYSDVETVEVGGPGLVKSGGGFMGGGLGMTGAAEGMAAAAVLNAITTRTSIKTIVRIQAANCELFFLHTKLAPEQLRIALSCPLGAIRSAQAATKPAIQESHSHIYPIEELSKLASMLDNGLLTRDEFDRLKAKILADS